MKKFLHPDTTTPLTPLELSLAGVMTAPVTTVKNK